MTRLFLRAWNAPGLVLLMMIGIALQSALFSYYPFVYLQPDIIIMAVIWCALKRDFTDGGILVLIFSQIAEIHSGAPQGIYMVGYILIYLLIRLSSKYFILQSLSALIGLTLAASIFWKLSNLGILHLLGLSANKWRHTLTLLLPGAVMNGILAIWVFRLLERYDWVTYKDPRARQALDDELLLDEEGL